MTSMPNGSTPREPLGHERERLVEAEAEYRRARSEDYVARVIRDAAIVDAHRAGMSSAEISTLIGDIGQPNVVRARRRAKMRQVSTPGDLLSPADALRASGLTPAEFVAAVRDGRVHPVDLGDGARGFRPDDVDGLRTKGAANPGGQAVAPSVG